MLVAVIFDFLQDVPRSQVSNQFRGFETGLARNARPPDPAETFVRPDVWPSSSNGAASVMLRPDLLIRMRCICDRFSSAELWSLWCACHLRVAPARRGFTIMEFPSGDPMIRFVTMGCVTLVVEPSLENQEVSLSDLLRGATETISLVRIASPAALQLVLTVRADLIVIENVSANFGCSEGVLDYFVSVFPPEEFVVYAITQDSEDAAKVVLPVSWDSACGDLMFSRIGTALQVSLSSIQRADSNV
mmetsp:Transcript_106284/g.243333  ORF Transcript_106284/g.243333 Transcript_106284/m.243333 type:complete len:246 (+) Transcript_106284:370-1107(+)